MRSTNDAFASELSQLANEATPLPLRSQASCKAYCSQSGGPGGLREESEVAGSKILRCAQDDRGFIDPILWMGCGDGWLAQAIDI